MAAPRLLRFDRHPRATLIPVAMGASALVYSVLTDYELGAMRIIPMPAHLALDAASGGMLAASPWLLGFAGRVWKPHVALGLLEILVVALSKHEPPWARPETAALSPTPSRSS